MRYGSRRACRSLSHLKERTSFGRVPEDFGPTVSLLLRSMGYRDALIGGLLLQAGLRGRPTAGWFLASAGADTADLVGGLTNHAQMTREQRGRGYAGAVVGIAVGLLGAARDAIR